MRVLRARGVDRGRDPVRRTARAAAPGAGALERIPAPQAGRARGRARAAAGAGHDRFAVGAATLSLLAAYAEEAPVAALRRRRPLARRIAAEALLFAVRRLSPTRSRSSSPSRDGEVSCSTAPSCHAAPRRPRSRGGRAPLLGDGGRSTRLYAATGRQPARAARARAGEPRARRRFRWTHPLPIAAQHRARRSCARGALPEPRGARWWSRPRATRASCALERARRQGRRLGARRRPRQPGSSPFATGRFEFATPRPLGALRRRGGRERAISTPGAGGALPGPRRRPARLAPRARHRRSRRHRRCRARAGGRPRLRAQRLRRRGRRIRARGDTLGASRPAALPGRGRDVARRPGRAGDLFSSNTARRRRPDARGRDRAPARPDHGAARAGRRGARDPRRGRRARGATIRRPRRSCSPRRRILSFFAGDAREMLPDGRAGRRALAGLEGRAPILAGLARGMALILAGEGESGARSIRAAVARWRRRTSCATTRTSPVGRPWAAVASRGRSGARPLRARARDRPQPQRPWARSPTPLPRGPGLGDDQCLDQRPFSVQRGDHARARDRAGRHARLRARRARCARGPPGT